MRARLLWLLIVGAGASLFLSHVFGAPASDPAEPLVRHPKSVELPPDAFCGNRSGSKWCKVDFVNLAVYRESLKGARVYILGYLSVDSKQVSLYASMQDYEMLERGRSLEIRGGLQELRTMVTEHGYDYVRIEGIFGVDEKTNKAGRLGFLRPPFYVRGVIPRSTRETYDDIGVGVEYLQK